MKDFTKTAVNNVNNVEKKVLQCAAFPTGLEVLSNPLMGFNGVISDVETVLVKRKMFLQQLENKKNKGRPLTESQLEQWAKLSEVTAHLDHIDELKSFHNKRHDEYKKAREVFAAEKSREDHARSIELANQQFFYTHVVNHLRRPDLKKQFVDGTNDVEKLSSTELKMLETIIDAFCPRTDAIFNAKDLAEMSQDCAKSIYAIMHSSLEKVEGFTGRELNALLQKLVDVSFYKKPKTKTTKTNEDAKVTQETPLPTTGQPAPKQNGKAETKKSDRRRKKANNGSEVAVENESTNPTKTSEYVQKAEDKPQSVPASKVVFADGQKTAEVAAEFVFNESNKTLASKSTESCEVLSKEDVKHIKKIFATLSVSQPDAPAPSVVDAVQPKQEAVANGSPVLSELSAPSTGSSEDGSKPTVNKEEAVAKAKTFNNRRKFKKYTSNGTSNGEHTEEKVIASVTDTVKSEAKQQEARNGSGDRQQFRKPRPAGDSVNGERRGPRDGQFGNGPRRPRPYSGAQNGYNGAQNGYTGAQNGYSGAQNGYTGGSARTYYEQKTTRTCGFNFGPPGTKNDWF